MGYPFSRNLERYFSHPSQDEDTRRKVVILASCLLVLIPAIYLISGIHLLTGQWQEVWPGFILASCMSFLLLVMRSLKSITIPFRVIALLSLVTLAYLLKIGAGNGHVFVWFYCYPMVVFYVTGKKAGLFWVATSLVVATWIFFFTSARELYGVLSPLRYLLTYTIVAAIAYGLDSSRTHYYQELLVEKMALEKALQQIKTLRGLLPICASCKSIRDDRGYWSRIETYLDEHSELKLSHGICPACMEKLYPEEFAEMTKSGHLPT